MTRILGNRAGMAVAAAALVTLAAAALELAALVAGWR